MLVGLEKKLKSQGTPVPLIGYRRAGSSSPPRSISTGVHTNPAGRLWVLTLDKQNQMCQAENAMARDREKLRAKSRRWRTKHLDQCRVKQAKYYREHPDMYLLNACRCRARAKGVPFNLTKEDIVIPSVCPVLGIPLEHGTKGFHENSPSIDRILPDKGYVRGNIIVISFRANRMKQNATTKELRQLADFFERLERETQSESPAPSKD